MFDARLSQRLLSRGHYARKSALDFDLGLNELLRAGSAKACVVTGLLVHHYGFGKCEEYLREHVPLELVWNYLEGLSRKPGWNAAPSQAQPGQAQPPLRLIS